MSLWRDASFINHNLSFLRDKNLVLPMFDSQLGHEIFLYPTASTPTLVSMQPPIQRVPRWSLSLQLKRPGSEANHLHLALRSRMVELYLSVSYTSS
jgi:hypothetical protein